MFGWSLRDGVTLSGRGCPRSRSERRPFAHLPWWLVSSLRDGVTSFGSGAAFCALDRNEGFFRSSILSCFAMGSPSRVESVSVLDWNEVSSSTFLVFGWSLRDGVTLSGRGCPRSRSERRPFAHLPWWLVSSLRDGVTSFGSGAAFCALDRNEGFFRSSILSCFAMGSPCGSGVFSAHSIVTKPTLVRCSVFLQDGVPLSGLDLLI